MNKLIFLAIVFFLCLTSCKETAPKYTHETTSNNLNLKIDITHQRSVAYESLNQDPDIIYLRLNILDEKNVTLKTDGWNGDTLTFKIDGYTVLPQEQTCPDIISLAFCGYYVEYHFRNLINEPFEIQVTISRKSGEILHGSFTIPKMISIEEPASPFAQIIPNKTNTILQWNSGTPITYFSLNGAAAGQCEIQHRSYNVSDNKNNVMLDSELFIPLNEACSNYDYLVGEMGYTIKLNDTNSNFNNYDVTFSDTMHLLLAEPH